MRETTERLRVAAMMGTRPEAIKLAPVLLAAREEPALDMTLISTGQHGEIHDQVLALFGLTPQFRVDVMQHGQSLASLSSRCLVQLARVLEESKPDLVLVQGDTTSAAMGGLAAFYARIPVWHVEAGLRTSTPDMPFPEEMNRRLIGRLASFHLAATETGRQNLLREGINDQSIAVTGNTGIDALFIALRLRQRFEDPVLEAATTTDGPVLVVTAHRRENWGAGIRSVAAASRVLLDAFPELRVIHAAHPNPSVRADVESELGGHPRATIVDAVAYGDFVRLLSRASVIVTDSGGIQEEAPSLGVPVLVTRVETERVESVQAGLSRVVGVDRHVIVAEVTRLLREPVARSEVHAEENPYGDGRAAERIIQLLVGRSRGGATTRHTIGSFVSRRPGRTTLATNDSTSGDATRDLGSTPVVAFSSNDWSDIPSSTSQLMRQLARTRTVLYVDTLGIRTPRISRRDARRALGKLRRSIGGVRRVERNLYVWSPVAVPLHGSAAARWFNAEVLAMLTRRVMRKLEIRKPIVYAALPSALALVSRLPQSALVYHCVDDYREFTGAPRQAYEVMEEGLLRLADLTVVSAPRLFELRRGDARKIVYLPHGVDVDSFERSLEQDVLLPDIDDIAKPIAGFVGRVGDWIDLDLILRCAREMPDWCFVVIGPTNVDLEPYAGHSNLVFLGPKPHRDIPHYIRRFSVGLLPFVDNDVSASVNPLKLYEYLAVGTPVVSTSSLDMSEFADVVDIASPVEFAAAIRSASESDEPKRREARRMFVARYSWASIADQLIRALENTPAVGQGGHRE